MKKPVQDLDQVRSAKIVKRCAPEPLFATNMCMKKARTCETCLGHAALAASRPENDPNSQQPLSLGELV